MRKRIFSFVLALLMMLSIMPIGVMAAAGTWDGTTVAEPAQEGGVYQIDTAEKLAWFAKQTQTNGNSGISAKLTADINLNNQNWLDYIIGGSGENAVKYSGTFDGDGHTISGFYLSKAFTTNSTSYLGLFGYVESGTVKNLTVDGAMTLDMAKASEAIPDCYAGGVVSYLIGGTIENVINDVEITIDNDTKSYATMPCGGVSAYASYKAVTNADSSYTIVNSMIKNCENKADITGGGYAAGICARLMDVSTAENCKNSGTIYGKTDYAGGISGRMQGGIIESCVNTGSISAEMHAGGIAGALNMVVNKTTENAGNRPGIVKHCYNSGAITVRSTKTTACSGGIAGDASGNGWYTILLSSIMENCYNAGTVTSDHDLRWVGAIAGNYSWMEVANLYYLDTSAAVSIGNPTSSRDKATAKTSEELKSAEFLALIGDAFKEDTGNVNNGYPILTWQPSSGSTEPEEPEVPVTEAYTISAGEDSQINIGEDATVTLTVTNDNETAYNAYFITVAYDTAKLAYKAINTDATVKDENGTLTIAGYGDDKTCGTDNLVLTFTGKASGDAEVSVTAAKIDKSESATVHDAPDATIAAASKVTVSVGGYQVTLDENFEGESTVMPGADYTFTAKDPHYDYTFDAKMGEDAVTPTDNGDGTFTIKNVTGNLNIKAASKTPKTYTVTVEGDGKADVTAANSATYGTDYSFKLTKDDKYIYEVTVTVGGDVLQPTVSEDRSTYTIAGSDVTGNIIISVSKEAKPVETTEITFTGTGSADVKGGTTQNAENGKDFLFEINADENYEYTVTLGDETLTANDEGKYTIPAAKITGTALTVNVEKTEKSALTIDVSEYIDLNGKIMWLVKAAGTVSEGKVLAYDGSAMFWSEKYNAYSFLVVSTNTEEQMKTEAAGKIAEADAEKTELAYNFDVNLSGKVDINDAQLTYDMYNAKYEDFDTVSMHKFLEADVTGDGKLTVGDATAVVNSFIN